jgi:hypothetical protein
MPYELIARICVSDKSLQERLEIKGLRVSADDATKEQIADCIQSALQAAQESASRHEDHYFPDIMFAVDPESVSVCDPEAWALEYLPADPMKLVKEVLAMLEAGTYKSSYEGQMIDKLRAAAARMEKDSK